MKKALSILKKILNIVVIILVISFLLMVILQRFTNNEISFFNYRMFTVASGSMAPEYEVGDVLISRKTPEDEIKVGDSITYLGKQGSVKGKVVTHEVTRIEQDEEGTYIFHTKGKANLIEDPPVYTEQIYGVVVYNPKFLSFVYKIINTQYGLFIFVVLPIFYIIGSEMLAAMLEKEEERRQKLKDKKEQENKPKEQEEAKETNKKEVKQEKPDVKEEKEIKEEKKTKSTSKKKTTSTKSKSKDK